MTVKRMLRWLAAALTLGLAVTSGERDAEADFRAGGRRRKPGRRRPGRRRPGRRRPGRRKPGRRKPGGRKKGPTTEELIKRYTKIVLAQPGSPFPLQRLAQLYRKKDGNLSGLLADFEKRAKASGHSGWAAKVALAGLLRQAGKIEQAKTRYEEAIKAKPNKPGPRLALAELLRAQGSTTKARGQYEKALPLLKSRAEKEQVLRSLLSIALDQKDLKRSRAYHQRLIKLSGNSLFVKGELGRAFMARGQYAEAEVEFKRLVKAAAGDNRALAPALQALGESQAKQKKNKVALKTLKRAMRIAGREAGVRQQILQTIAQLYRADSNLAELIKLMEKQRPNDFQRLVLLAELYEETGAVGKAIKTYRKALSKKRRHIGVRLKVVRLLQAQGDLDQAIKETGELIKSAPRNPDYVFQLCEVLLQRGDRKKALEHLKKLESKAKDDEDILVRVADFYERIDEKARATALFAKLAKVAPRDPAHLVELGDRYWEAGDKEKAKKTWELIRKRVPNKARGLTALGEVYLEHDMTSQALKAFREAMKAAPGKHRYKKSYAVALERVAAAAGSRGAGRGRFKEAEAIWLEILKTSGSRPMRAREARAHLVTLWTLSHQLNVHVEPLKRRLSDSPPDLMAGRLLAEVQMRLRKFEDAEKTLGRVTKLAPGDEEAFLALERVQVMSQNLKGAIVALKKLVEINPKRAREYYQRMAKYSSELYKDDDAIRYAAKAVALSPDDAHGHRNLGDMYRRRQDYKRAISEYRQAIAKNDRLFSVYMSLGELLRTQGDPKGAARLYSRVIRSAPDEELVAQAGRLAIQHHLAKKSLQDVENILIPLALGNPSKSVYRRLLVEVYGHMAFPLMQKARYGKPQEAQAARRKLQTIGSRGVKPLLDALRDPKSAQVRTAIDVLSFIRKKGAGPTLVSFATGDGPHDVRVRAMYAVGALDDPKLLPRLQKLVAPKDEEPLASGGPVTVAAAWAVARIDDRKARPVLKRMFAGNMPDVQAFGALGMAKQKTPKTAKLFRVRLNQGDVGPKTLAAMALASLYLRKGEALPLLKRLDGYADPLVQAAVMRAYLGWDPKAAARLAATGLFSENKLTRLAANRVLVASLAAPRRTLGGALDDHGDRVTIESVLRHSLPAAAPAAERHRALGAYGSLLATASEEAAGRSIGAAGRVAQALLAQGSEDVAFAPLSDGLAQAKGADATKARKSAEAIRRRVISAFVALAHHPDSATRLNALRILRGRPEPEAKGALKAALADSDPQILRAALDAIAHTPNAGGQLEIAKILRSRQPWALRVQAAKTLGAVVPKDSALKAQVGKELAWAANHDSFAYVREAAKAALKQGGYPNG